MKVFPLAFHKITAFFPPLTLIASFFFVKDSSLLTMKAIKQPEKLVLSVKIK